VKISLRRFGRLHQPVIMIMISQIMTMQYLVDGDSSLLLNVGTCLAKLTTGQKSVTTRNAIVLIFTARRLSNFTQSMSF